MTELHEEKTAASKIYNKVDCMEQPQTPPKTSAQIAKEAEDKEAASIGYRSSEYKWFGESVPDSLSAKCLMCDHILHVDRENLFGANQLPEMCPSCKRKALKYPDDVKHWGHYIKLRLWEFEFFLDQYNTSHALYNNGSQHIFPVKSTDMERLLSMRCGNPNQIRTATTYLDGLAARGKIRTKLENRIAKLDGEIWIDAASEHGEAIKITADGWSIVEKPPMIFRRFDHMAPLIVEHGTKKDFEEYISLMNLSSEDDSKLLYMGYAAALFIPEIDHPILMPLGPQGSAKTTMSLMTKMLIDPSKVPLLSMPEDLQKLPLMFYFHHFPIFDNCNYFPPEASDTFCRACTGGGISTRKFYTNMEEVIFNFHSLIILNGISAPSMAPDLIDRTLIVNLDRILEQYRKKKSEIEEHRDALLPKVRGYLMGIVADALRSGPTPATTLPRLVDFGCWADACTTAMGYKQGEFLTAYLKLAKDSAKEAIRSDPLADTLLDYLHQGNGYDGPASALLKDLCAMAGANTKSPEWPKDSTRLSDSICGKLKAGLVLMGWNVKKTKSHGKRALVIWKEEKKEGGLMDYDKDDE